MTLSIEEELERPPETRKSYKERLTKAMLALRKLKKQQRNWKNSRYNGRSWQMKYVHLDKKYQKLLSEYKLLEGVVNDVRK